MSSAVAVIGDTFAKIGQTIYQAGELVGKAVWNVATCSGEACGGKKKVEEAGEQVKADAEALVDRNEQLEEQVQTLHAKLEEVETTQVSSATEANDKLSAQVQDLKDQVSDMETEAVTNMVAADEAKAEADKETKVVRETLASTLVELEEAENALRAEADVSKGLEAKNEKLQKSLDAAKAAAKKKK